MGSIPQRNDRETAMQEVNYCVVVLRTDIEESKKIFDAIRPSLDIAKGAYATEVGYITRKDTSFYKIGEPTDPQTWCLAIDKDNHVLGFIYLEADARTMTLWTSHVYVRPEVRGKGIYKLMMERVQKFAKDAKFKRVFSIVHQRNTASQRAHKSVGFKKRWIGYEINEDEVANDNIG